MADRDHKTNTWATRLTCNECLSGPQRVMSANSRHSGATLLSGATLRKLLIMMGASDGRFDESFQKWYVCNDRLQYVRLMHAKPINMAKM